MHPIHFAVLIVLIAGALSYQMANPLIFVIGLLLSQQCVGRFSQDEDDEERGSGVPFGFVPPDDPDQ